MKTYADLLRNANDRLNRLIRGETTIRVRHTQHSDDHVSVQIVEEETPKMTNENAVPFLKSQLVQLSRDKISLQMEKIRLEQELDEAMDIIRKAKNEIGYGTEKAYWTLSKYLERKYLERVRKDNP